MICLGVAIYPVNYELGLAIRGAINENISQSKFPARRRGKHKNELYPRLQDRRLYQNTTFFRKCGDRQSQIEHMHTRHRLPTQGEAKPSFILDWCTLKGKRATEFPR